MAAAGFAPLHFPSASEPAPAWRLEAAQYSAEAEARARGRTLLTFDTMAGSAAEKLYLGLGYVRVGEIPRYALYPDGSGPAATAILYKLLA